LSEVAQMMGERLDTMILRFRIRDMAIPPELEDAKTHVKVFGDFDMRLLMEILS
jgi:hypothetical protein